MLRIDAHQHFWKFDAIRDSWINEEMKAIQRDFLPADLLPVLKQNGIDGSVAVQADQSLDETKFLLELSNNNDFIKGVVGWVNLQAVDIEEQLQELSRNKKLKGFRHILQGERDVEYMMRPLFLRGINYLRRFNFTYDLLIHPRHLPIAIQIVQLFPAQRFVIDHLAKPMIKEHKLKGWEKDMKAIGQFENVFCKISGMVTEADWKQWKEEDFTPYLNVIFSTFGSSRVMFGSDWPVCLVAASYEKMLTIVQDYTRNFTPGEQLAFWGGNAISFYNLT
ncbi:MAG: amidohydrolase family protein [Chitinophagaceae bacterium]